MANNQFPGPTFHRLDTRHCGLQTKARNFESTKREEVVPFSCFRDSHLVAAIGRAVPSVDELLLSDQG